MPKITYFVETHEPEIEAISKEVELLSKNFQSTIYDAVSNKFNFSKNFIAFNYKRFPFGLLSLPFIEKKTDLSHIYTSLGNYFYLRLLRKKPIVLTAAGASSKEKIKKCLPFYKNLNKIIVESEKDKKMLLSLGVDNKKIFLIYPGINLKKFKYKQAKGKFKILFASSPMQEIHFKSRGIYLLIEAAKELPDIEFILLWRGKYLNKIKSFVSGIDNIKIINKKIRDISKIYEQAHATILPFTSYLNTKPCPHSAIESLASGKPVLVTDVSGIVGLVRKEKCGIITKTTKKGIIEGIIKLRKSYKAFQKNCFKVAKRYFDEQRFVRNYKKIYNELY